ncbi:MAG: 16S rRNA (adenine(1518)-N(6)/adenine(1519)-N(6))-dimethyltransferase RsmA [Gammaproteobacteria bacterium]
MSRHQPRKRFGQHFLTDPVAISNVLELVEIPAGGTLVEIGPGQGVLTEPLLERCDQLIAIEIDRDLAAALRHRFAQQPRFTLVEMDALKLHLSDFTPRQVTLVGNLPYNISTPLLFHLFQQRHLIESMLFMLQKEVVERMAAVPGNKNYGRLSVMTQYYCQLESLTEIPPGSFDPPPRVDSQMVRLYPRIADQHDDPLSESMSTLVSAAFAHRRKTLRNNLSKLCWLRAVILAPGRRP